MLSSLLKTTSTSTSKKITQQLPSCKIPKLRPRFEDRLDLEEDLQDQPGPGNCLFNLVFYWTWTSLLNQGFEEKQDSDLEDSVSYMAIILKRDPFIKEPRSPRPCCQASPSKELPSLLVSSSGACARPRPPNEVPPALDKKRPHRRIWESREHRGVRCAFCSRSYMEGVVKDWRRLNRKSPW